MIQPLDTHITAFIALGARIKEMLAAEKEGRGDVFTDVLRRAEARNTWFTVENIRHALGAISDNLTEERLVEWLTPYRERIEERSTQRVVGVVMPGNIPLAGFHDLLCVLISGHLLLAKRSAQDTVLMIWIADQLKDINSALGASISFTEQLSGFDAAIATGSNNSARYFEYYFGKYPHIIRRNRNSVALLSGNEKKEEMELLADDVFLYFGMGCRSVSKIFVPHGYDFSTLHKGFQRYAALMNHHKYANNYAYNKAVCLLGKIPLLDNGLLLLREDRGCASPVAVLFYEYYANTKMLAVRLEEEQENLQCIVGGRNMGHQSIPFGSAQSPALHDYADGTDTMEFLLQVGRQ